MISISGLHNDDGAFIEAMPGDSGHHLQAGSFGWQQPRGQPVADRKRGRDRIRSSLPSGSVHRRTNTGTDSNPALSLFLVELQLDTRLLTDIPNMVFFFILSNS